MVKRKKTTSSQSDTKVAAIVIGLFAALVLLFFIVTKGKESHHPEASAPVPVKVVESPLPEERNAPLEPVPVHVYHPVVSRPRPEPERVPGSGGKIAFIIDDWGQSAAPCKFLREIPEPIAVSILPGLRHTKDVANCAQLNHKLTMLHLPLEALHNYDVYTKNYIIKTNMKPELVNEIFDGDLAQLPSIEGVNNHMGSKATENRPLMRIIFTKVKQRGLFFVDSMTTPHSVCTGLADEMGLPFGKRDVFLDNIITREAITKQYLILAQKARRRGYAVAIGHAFNRLTMQILKEQIPLLERQGFTIVSIKDLLRNR